MWAKVLHHPAEVLQYILFIAFFVCVVHQSFSPRRRYRCTSSDLSRCLFWVEKQQWTHYPPPQRNKRKSEKLLFRRDRTGKAAGSAGFLSLLNGVCCWNWDYFPSYQVYTFHCAGPVQSLEAVGLYYAVIWNSRWWVFAAVSLPLNIPNHDHHHRCLWPLCEFGVLQAFDAWLRPTVAVYFKLSD